MMICFLRRTLSLCAATLSVIASAQNSSDPGSPGNWRVTVQNDGHGQSCGIERNPNTGQDESYDNPVSDAYFDCSIYRLTHSATKSGACSGTSTFTIQWIGDPSHVPDKVLVHLTGEASYSNSGDGEVVGDGDPGLPIIDTYDDGYDTYKDGEAYRQLSVSGNKATVTLSGSAQATVNYTPTSYRDRAGGHGYWVAECEVTNRALTVDPSPQDTYYRRVDLSGVSRGLNVAENLNLRKVTLGMSVSDQGNGELQGDVSVTGTAGLIGYWVPQVNYNWTTSALSLVQGYPVPPTVTGYLGVGQAELVQMAKGSSKTADLQLTASDSSGLGSMSATLLADIHAPVEYLSQSDHPQRDGEELVIMNGQPVRAYLASVGQSQTLALTHATTITHLPNTWVFSGSGAGDISELIKLTLGISFSHPSSPQEAVADQLTQTLTAGPSTSAGEVWEVHATTIWTQADTLWADYGNDGYDDDRTTQSVRPGSISVTPFCIKVGNA